MCGLLSSVCICPCEVIKVRAQTGSAPPKSLSDLFCGLGALLRFDVPYNMLSLLVEAAYKRRRYAVSCDPESPLNQLLGGGLSGFVTWAILFPLDRLKTLT